MMMRRSFDFPAVPPIFLLLLIITAAPARAYSQVVINEVYYDHPGSDAGFEYVELVSRAAADVSLDGLSIAMVDGMTGAVRELWRAGPGRSICSGCLLLIGGDSCVTEPEDLLAGSIENGPDAVALLRGEEEIDLVRFGGEDPDCTAGRSLSRLPGAAGFVCANPTPGRSNFHDIDLSIEPGASVHVHCAAGSLHIPVLIENRGLNRFSASLSVTVIRVLPEGGMVVGSVSASPLLCEGESIELPVSCRGLPPGVSTLDLLLETEGDTNPANDNGSLRVGSSPGEIVITEIMYRPGDGSEWIELFNRSAGPVDLSGWSVADRSGNSGSIACGTDIGAGGFLVIAQDPEIFSSTFPLFGGDVLPLEDRWPRLNDGDGNGTAEEIFLKRSDGAVMESVWYRGMLSDEKGRSLERLSPELCSAVSEGIWLRCGAPDGSTPGARNYCHSSIVPSSGFTVSPDPFRPGIDGTAMFIAAAQPGDISYGARIFDMEGREVSRLASGPVGAPAVSFTWDGCDRQGRATGTGLYICVVEFTGRGGGICRREKVTVRIWAGP
jgi:hypothetical protein